MREAIGVLLLVAVCTAGLYALTRFDEPGLQLYEQMAEDRGIESISIGYLKYDAEMAVEIECMIYVSWTDGREECLLD